MICLIIVFSVSVAAIGDLKDDEKSHKTLEFYLVVLIILSIFFLTTSIDYFATKKIGSYVNGIKTAALIAFIVLTLLICFSSFDSDKFGSSTTKTNMRAIAVSIGIFGLLAMGIYVFMKYKKFGPETQIQEVDNVKVEVEDYKRLALDQVQARLVKAAKATKNKDKESAYNVIISSIKNIKKTNDDKAKNKLLQYCSFLYSKLSYKLNNVASIYGPFNYNNAAVITGNNNVIDQQVNLSRLITDVTNTNNAYGMIEPANTPANSDTDRSKTPNLTNLRSINSDQGWKDYSKSLSAELFGSTSDGVKDALEDPIGSLKFIKPFCRDLIAFYPVTTKDPIPLTNNVNLDCS